MEATSSPASRIDTATYLATEPKRGSVRDRQIVVDRLGHANAGDRKIHLLAELRHLVGRVLRVTAAVVEEIADVMCLEYGNQPLVFGPVLLDAFQLVAAGAKGPAGVWRRAAMLAALSTLVSINSSCSAPMMPLRPANTLPSEACWRRFR